jgi:membrane fusion protein (multidrug efflux system)
MSVFWIKNNWVKNKSHTVNVILLTGLVATLAACNKAPENTALPAMPPVPVSVLSVQPTSVPMSVEAVAQTEGASEVEVRPRVGGIILKKLFEEGQPVKAGQVMFQIDPAPFQIALAQSRNWPLKRAAGFAIYQPARIR